MQKRYICFVCYKFHPEMRGASEEEFLAGDNVCKNEKCTRRGQPLEEGWLCEICDKILPNNTPHPHTTT